MKRKAIDQAAIKRAAVRSTRESASLERRTVPANYVRSAKTERFVVARNTQK